MEESIKVIDIWKKYNKSSDYALRDISLNFYKGEKHILLGPNGSGKSTLLKILSYMLKPTKGEFVYHNNNLKKSIKDQKKELGVLFDHNAHWDHLTGYENAWFFASYYGVDQDKIPGQLEYYFKWMELYDKKDELVKTYSYGMRKKLALIEALLHKPKILLLDEPSMGLDYQSRIAFYHMLDELSSKGITIIVASNDVNEAALLSDRISMLNKGKLLVSGKPDQLIKSLASYMKIDLELSLPIPLEGLREIEEIEEIKIDDNDKNNEFKLEFLIKPKDFSNYSLLVAKIVNEIVKKKGQIVNINVKTPNLGDLILKLANSGEYYASK